VADGQVRREVARELVAGSWDAVEPDNFRSIFPAYSQAEGYVTQDVGFMLGDTFLYAIVRVRFSLLRPTANRRGWDKLKPETRRNYLASKAAQREAQYHQLSVPEWYEVAPDLKAFRRHAKGRTGAESSTGGAQEFFVYIARDYRMTLGNEDALRISAGVREAHARRASVGDLMADAMRDFT
jgi:hypothetical protein